MSEADAIFGHAAATSREVLGDAVIYESRSVSATAVTAVLGNVREDVRVDEREGEYWIDTRSAWMATDLVTPTADGWLTIGAARWNVETVAARAGGQVRLELIRVGSKRMARPGYRETR